MILLMVLILLFIFRRQNWSMKKIPSSNGMGGYSLIYADQKQNGKKDEGFGKLLYSAEYELQGKPDYIYKKRFGKGIVPVELKSGSIGESSLPHRGDLLQLGAYFLILEDVYKVRPKFGRLAYQDYIFVVKNTRSLRKEVMKTTKEMREMLLYGVGKANPSFATCRYCICNGTVCKYSETEIIGGKANGASGGEE
ncbi:hypothetical protein CLNEO_07830 [Anaerotignum neopropionicum]|uniref:PD-(D/E)XK endonuclease-like domain-containing protein n=1 Tax=Anaerotignum neopropionicum TaxID=36847 RepID=A0A136WGG4_9FIRM|nr:PD-(D/E)XK nuclease family protein [Anaerotignum neopropionicum]KXL53557.1 hypothetical protein CLNEO_07830 [Anaerotignum neopropionicum]